MKSFDGISLLKKFERTDAWVSIAEKRLGLTGSPMKLVAVATCLLSSSSNELGLLTEQAELSFLMMQSSSEAGTVVPIVWKGKPRLREKVTWQRPLRRYVSRAGIPAQVRLAQDLSL